MPPKLKTTIEDLRNFHGKTQEEVADAVGISLSQFRNWEKNRGSLADTIDKLIRLCHELQCDLEDLIEEVEEP